MESSGGGVGSTGEISLPEHPTENKNNPTRADNLRKQLDDFIYVPPSPLGKN